MRKLFPFQPSYSLFGYFNEELSNLRSNANVSLISNMLDLVFKQERASLKLKAFGNQQNLAII